MYRAKLELHVCKIRKQRGHWAFCKSKSFGQIKRPSSLDREEELNRRESMHFCEREHRTRFYVFYCVEKCLIRAIFGAKLKALAVNGPNVRSWVDPLRGEEG